MTKKLYILDDDIDFLQIAEHIFGKNYTLKTASRLNIRDVEHFQPDLILMDNAIGMQESGDMITALHDGIRSFDIPIILVSGHPSLSTIANKKGVVGFIPKPASISELREYVARFFESDGKRA